MPLRIKISLLFLIVARFSFAQNVGINTLTPQARLHIFKGSSGYVGVYPHQDLIIESNDHTWINLLAPNDREMGLLFGKPSHIASGGIVYDINNNMHFRTNGNINRMIINSSGNVGIGTTTPAAGLDIYHDNDVGNPTLRLFDNSAAGSPTIQFQNAGGNENWQIVSFVNNSNISLSEIVFQNTLGQHLNIRGDGKVGIGKVPTERLDVNGTVKAMNINTSGIVKANSFSFNTPKSYTYTLGGPDFSAALSSETISIDLPFGGAKLTAGSRGITAPVHLPQGAHITGFQVYFSDNSTQTLTVILRRYNIIGGLFDDLASIESVNTVQGFGSNFTDNISYADLDADYFYVVLAITNASPWSPDISVRAVNIFYTIPEL